MSGPGAYAGLANDAYVDRRVGVRGPHDEERVTIEGVEYRIREHVNNVRTGYQGTVYQRVEGGDIVVAHRGTEEIWKDGVVADGSMVAQRINPQARDAVELTGRAIEIARRDGRDPGKPAPEVTVTGHSLGGTLAQVSAHHFDLRGETFNAYGAASLNLRIPEGGTRVVNHVMAADAVSSASPHYGQVRIYATPREMAVLQQSGYHDNRIVDALGPDLPLVAAGRTLGSHSMHNFLPLDGNGRPDRAVVSDPATRALAQEHQRMIDDYRGDVGGLRRAVTIGAGGPAGLARDTVDYFRGPLPAGEPAAREAREREQRGGADARHSSLDVPRDNHGSGRAAVGSPGFATGSQQDQVARLLEAARNGNPDAIRSATQDLQLSPAGQAWQQRADAEAQTLASREAASQHTAAHQQAPQQHDLARGA